MIIKVILKKILIIHFNIFTFLYRVYTNITSITIQRKLFEEIVFKFNNFFLKI